MEAKAIRELVLHLLKTIAPEADLDGLQPGVGFRDQFDFDSVDFLNFALALEERLKVRIPEEDYPQLATLQSCVAYLEASTAGRPFDVVPAP